MRSGVYAGTFDMLTSGHWWMIEQGVALFDHLHIAIGVNSGKKGTPYFTTTERRGMIQECLDTFFVTGRGIGLKDKITVDVFEDKYLVNYARSIEANYLLRGIRSQADFDYERVLRNINGDIEPNIDTIFLMPPREIAEVSSSMVKGLIGPKGWENIVRKYLPIPVFRQVLEKERGRTT
jgi:pantetheine-phosphate adenylyltransferase/8-oxo-dGTP diphosphatase